jgi:hypothetical protein
MGKVEEEEEVSTFPKRLAVHKIRDLGGTF